MIEEKNVHNAVTKREERGSFKQITELVLKVEWCCNVVEYYFSKEHFNFYVSSETVLEFSTCDKRHKKAIKIYTCSKKKQIADRVQSHYIVLPPENRIILLPVDICCYIV